MSEKILGGVEGESVDILGFVGVVIIAFISDLRDSSWANSFSSRFSNWTVTLGDTGACTEELQVFVLEIALAALRTSRFIRESMDEVEEALKLGMDWEV